MIQTGTNSCVQWEYDVNGETYLIRVWLSNPNAFYVLKFVSLDDVIYQGMSASSFKGALDLLQEIEQQEALTTSP